ncbi:UMP kinase [candidate division WOR-3 bacterium]|uniref:Uridylate kinase n=1 Tax=candidate division WOR-3 bacterium TaxID=2052148 RepID=A0A9D5QD53_UNCW3|nr:UMP kinase [candidate division WOR-3 bacterium]MBD3365264.1 UMP kinase [candidate division WOR-3 bacterium]
MKYQQGLLLKLSGEVFSNSEICRGVVSEMTALSGKIRFAVLLGGGNHIRGNSYGQSGSTRVFADRMGMIGTLLNGLWLESMLREEGVQAVHMSAVPLTWVKRYDPVKARDAYSSGQILILTGGTGLPYFSTDTSAVLRAVELGVDKVLKGTKVKGVFSADPETDPDAEFFPLLTYSDALSLNLAIMDQTAFSLAREHNLIIQVFNVFDTGNIGRIVKGEKIGTLVSRKEEL